MTKGYAKRIEMFDGAEGEEEYHVWKAYIQAPNGQWIPLDYQHTQASAVEDYLRYFGFKVVDRQTV